MLSLFSSSLGALLRQARLAAAAADAPSPPEPGPSEPAWLNAYQQRLLQQDPAPAEPLPVLGLKPHTPEPELPRVAALAPTETVQRVEALLVQAPVAPPRVWQVELPAAGPGWQLRVEQAQPQAPLLLDLRVPAVLQTQARRALADLDKRLRDTGHDVLSSRLQGQPLVRPYRVDEVQP